MDPFQITIAAARVNAGMTQEEAAKALGINRTTLIKWENGQVIPGTIQLIALANTYKIPIDYIFVPKATT
jgi:DNA-binding XRE family transcriptional regulator